MHFTVAAIICIGSAVSVFALPSDTALAERFPGRFSGTIQTPRATGLKSELDLSYEYMTVTVQVGTPPQNQTLTFDTGSPFFWVYTGDSDGLYDISASSSFTNQTTSFDAGVGNAYGYWANETIDVGAFNVEGATIGMVDGTGHTEGGAMGFSPPSASDPAFGTWTSQLANSLESPIAGLNIYEDSPGPITFGYLDNNQYVGDLTWVDIDTTTGSSWTASTVYFSINGTATSASAGLPAIMDTGGTVFLSLDEAVVKEYYSQIPSAKDVSSGGDATAWTVDCDATMPDIQLAFSEDANGVSDPAAIILGSRLVNFGSSTDGTCQAYVNAGQSQSLSRSFFLSNYVALDFTQGATRVGMALKSKYEVIATPEGGSAGPHNATNPAAPSTTFPASPSSTPTWSNSSSASSSSSSTSSASSSATSSGASPSPTKSAGTRDFETGGSARLVLVAFVGLMTVAIGNFFL